MEIAIGAGYGHDGAVAINGVPGFSEIPAAASGALGEMADRLANRRS